MKGKKSLIIGIIIVIVIAIIGGIIFSKVTNNKNSANEISENQMTIDEDKVINIKEDEEKYTTTFNKGNTKFEFNYEDADVINEILNEDLDLSISLVYNEYSKKEYDEFKKFEMKESDGAKEYTWNGYKGFSYGINSIQTKFSVLMEDKDNNVVALEGTVTYIDNEETNVPDVFESNTVQDFLNTMKFER